MKRSEALKLIEAHKTSLRKSMKKTETEPLRKSAGDPNVEVKSENVSILKYIRGGMFGNWEGATEELKIFKAFGQDAGTRGGFFVPSQLMGGVIELLKEKAVVRNLPGVRKIEVSGTDKIKMNRIANAPSISWGGESSTISEDTTMDFDNTTLETHKAVCLLKMSSEILRNANVSFEPMVRQELADALGLEEDKVLLEGTGGDRPLGFYFNAQVVSTDLSGAIGVSNIRDAMYQVRILHAAYPTAWVCHPRTAKQLAALNDAEGRPIFGTGPGLGTVTSLWGTPLVETTQVAIDARPGASESYIVGGNWSDFIIGDGMGMQIATSTEADTAFAADQVWMRLIRFIGSQVRHPESFVVIKGISA